MPELWHPRRVKKAPSKKPAPKKTAPAKSANQASAKRRAVEKPPAKSGSVAKVPAKNRSAATSPAKKKAMASRSASSSTARRADYGAPIDQFFEKHDGELREVIDALRKLVEAAAPDANAALKWGMPFYTVAGEMYCAIGGHKAHVNLILPGAPGTFKDPDGLLAGEGKTGQHLKLRSRKDLPEKTVREWLKLAAANARAKAG